MLISVLRISDNLVDTNSKHPKHQPQQGNKLHQRKSQPEKQIATDRSGKFLPPQGQFHGAVPVHNVRNNVNHRQHQQPQHHQQHHVQHQPHLQHRVLAPQIHVQNHQPQKPQQKNPTVHQHNVRRIPSTMAAPTPQTRVLQQNSNFEKINLRFGNSNVNPFDHRQGRQLSSNDNFKKPQIVQNEPKSIVRKTTSTKPLVKSEDPILINFEDFGEMSKIHRYEVGILKLFH